MNMALAEDRRMLALRPWMQHTDTWVMQSRHKLHRDPSSARHLLACASSMATSVLGGVAVELQHGDNKGDDKEHHNNGCEDCALVAGLALGLVGPHALLLAS